MSKKEKDGYAKGIKKSNERKMKIAAIAPIIKNHSTSIYSCYDCRLFYTSEDIRAGLFIKVDMKCIRCSMIQRMKKLEIKTPDCFGVSFDNSSALCSKRCGLNKACRIQFVEGNYAERPVLEKNGKKQTYRSHLIRILRAVGRPIHIYDLAPSMERETRKRYRFDPGGNWYALLQRILDVSPEVIKLSEGFYVWDGCWSGDGERGHGAKGRVGTFNLDSLEEIWQKIEQDSNEFE